MIEVKGRGFDFCATIINYSIDIDKPITNLKLQMLVYFIRKEHYKMQGYDIIEEDFQKWRFGPVVPDFYNEFKINSTNKIREKVTTKNIIDDSFMIKTLEFNPEDSFTEEELTIIKKVVLKYVDIDGWDMSAAINLEIEKLNLPNRATIKSEMIFNK